ncbi:MAG: leucyl aminopeptidase family protein [Bradyrhizobiaceae bacterium]|nr:leucyl aminopeptidase family protein [Bradyrhizobiaceae bacterium]
MDKLHAAFAPPSAWGGALPIWCVDADSWAAIRGGLPPAARGFADVAGFKPEAGNALLLPGGNGAVAGALFAFDKPSVRPRNPFLAGKLAGILPAGDWRFASPPPDPRLAALAFGLGQYRFTRYRKSEAKDVRLVLPDGVDGAELTRTIDAVFLVRDLVNTPSNDCGPADIEAAARAIAERFGASFRAVVGDDLLGENFSLVHAVGRASARAPRLIEFTWGDAKHPRVTLVGKGVCFDTGGLDIKPSSGMLLMKKDMGGAAHALGLAQMIMDAKLPVRLQVVIPAVENAISGEAFRPGDIFKSRKGDTVEIGNTDAEGRLILADALALAGENEPDLIVDFATLTGSARVALGPELPAAFTDDDDLAIAFARHADAEADPHWRLPLWRPYQSMLESKVADTNNVSSGSFAGAITAALFLSRFVGRAKSWLHLDLFAWNPSARPGRPEGGEAQTIRALFALLAERYR